MNCTTSEILAWQKSVSHWFKVNSINYPWRLTSDPYEILVSELMLQQTRISTVLEKKYYENWLKKFPNVSVLSQASEEDVLKAWEGLGYYNRARNLKNAAKYIEDELDGVFPNSLEAILQLPGVGPYTAGAVCSFAFGKKATIVDGNVIRVLARVFGYETIVDSSEGKKQINKWAEALTPEEDIISYNSGIMELGQQICRKGTPNCAICPVSNFCGVKDTALAADLPRKKKAPKITRKTENVALFVENGKIWLCEESGSRRNGLWKLPPISAGSSDFVEIDEITYAITRYQIKMTVHCPQKTKSISEILKNSPGEWFSLDSELPPLGAPYLRAITRFQTIQKKKQTG